MDSAGRDEDPMTLYQRFQNSFHQIASKDSSFPQKPEEMGAAGGGGDPNVFLPHQVCVSTLSLIL